MKKKLKNFKTGILSIINQLISWVVNRYRLKYLVLRFLIILNFIKNSFASSARESYKLDYICHLEIGEKKVSYEEYGNIFQLYKQNFQKFMDYNIRDVNLIERLDDKLKLIELALTFCMILKLIMKMCLNKQGCGILWYIII